MELDHLAILRVELGAFHGHLGGDLGAPVVHCGDWTVRDLAEHLGHGNLWAATAVTERRGDLDPPPAPADIAPWFADTARILAETLEADPGTEAWTFAPPRTVGFWRRRRCLETVVHRWDIEHALGLPSAMDPALCADGVDEVVAMFVPREVRLRRMPELPGAVRLTTTDGKASWVLGPGEPAAELAATAEDLMLMLWKRRSIPWEQITGDQRTARGVLESQLTP